MSRFFFDCSFCCCHKSSIEFYRGRSFFLLESEFDFLPAGWLSDKATSAGSGGGGVGGDHHSHNCLLDWIKITDYDLF